MILFRLVHRDTEFASDIVLELIVVPIQMVFRDIGQNGNVGSKTNDVVQLKTADLRHIPLLRVFRYLPCKRVSYIANQRTIQSSMTADMVDHGGGGRFSIAPRYANDPAVPFMTVS